ncbi:MAG: N-acetylmuramoyl-L-alanine amidase, partial [Thermodesulfobacteriota bacterium]|nr:N-acetylmuramoyl-L-alanine amidase [Thermodesulfobacteriota bacterium]
MDLKEFMADTKKLPPISRRSALKGLAAAGLATCLFPGTAFCAESAFDLGLTGQDLLARGDFQGALAALLKAAELEPENEWIWGLLGRANYHLGNRREAVTSFRKALQLNPEDTYSRMMIDMITQKPLPSKLKPEKPKSALELKAEREERQVFEKLSAREGLGYRVKRVVLDPGHGGFDPGAVGLNKLQEKNVTLELVKRTAGILGQTAPNIKIFLTRTGDYYVPLSARTATANQYHADLFVSFHINANENRKARGSETYFCSETASSKEAERLAKFENSVLKFDQGSVVEKGHIDLEDILFRFERKRYWQAGGKAADAVQKLFAQKLPFKNRGVNSANFFVLRRAR